LPRIEVAGGSVRVEAELVRHAVDDAPRQDPVERHPGVERALQRRSVPGCLLRHDERFRAPRRAEHRAVDARRRCEAGAWDAPDDAQLVPRSPGAAEQRRGPDRGSLRREPPLHDRIELGQWDARVAEQPAQDRRAGGEGQVRHDGERLGGQRDEPRVALDHFDAWIGTEAGPQLLKRYLVELDCTHAGTAVRERACDRAAAGAEVEHERPGQDPGVPDELVGEGATTKCVATARPRLW